MKIKEVDRRLMSRFLPKNYRVAVVDRLREKGIVIHPNTVRNVWMGFTANPLVAEEIFDLIKYEKRKHVKFHMAKKAALRLDEKLQSQLIDQE